MGHVSLRSIAAAWVLVVATSACSHASDDATATATASPAASAIASVVPAQTVAPAATAVASGGASIDDKREAFTKNGVTSAMGVATESDLSEIGLPIYPTITLENTFLVKHVDRRAASYRLQVSVKDGIDTVTSWYQKKLGTAFKFGRTTALGGISSFVRKTPTSSESILLQSQRDQNLNIPLTTITLTVTKRR